MLYEVITAFQGVVGVDQQHASVGKTFRIGAKGAEFVGKGHDPAVGMGAFDRNAEAVPGQDVAGGADTADVSGASQTEA